ncbi:Heme/copper-type cytochrome/quinol oxidase, subunit 3 [endosymbiont of Ridgeia piscesae]|jgi:cytochrome c oxidase subunit 3|uniref:Cytochrome c oxidase subunit 3 n=2 Tax=endosymbiont of Ridgeia piscesae TaxID=54398 RepID=A0A0T5YZU2_9GAMM|nr:Heme/copper-type cytochrome/quinol oxidase, subunit 3 [endosymbiont of Ridgeia piscesae]KRT58340.1 cytochrome c oxidase subunit 3 [endosymbiont of Ridgeia piscesae]
MDVAITADPAQTRRTNDAPTLPTASRVPGGWPIWVGIFSEMSEFAMMFIIYFIAKAHYPELFNDGPTRLNTLAGVLNTLVLLTSSYCVAKSMQAIRRDDSTACVRWLWLAILAGAAYLLIKSWEYHWNESVGITKDTNTFFTVYYYTTFNHMLHVGWGSAAVLWAIMGIKRGSFTAQNHGGLEAVACYWHMIDLAWIVIFPLLYVLR